MGIGEGRDVCVWAGGGGGGDKCREVMGKGGLLCLCYVVLV